MRGRPIKRTLRDGLEDALRIRLAVGNDIEPSWRVIRGDEAEGVSFKPVDRAKVSVSLIGALSDLHLNWSRGSLLSRLTETESISLTLVEAGRAAKAALDTHRAQSLSQFDAVAQSAEKTARSLGVNVATAYKAHLDADSINIRLGSLALHDGEMPLRQLGLGSKRMLTTGLQKKTLHAPHVTLFDEVEIGLEPYRIARLIEHLKTDATGQYFLTTHSPVVLRELTVDDLHIVHCRDGRIQIVAANKPAIAECVQGKIRTGAEAFLAPKIVACEGATEAGFLRGLDDYWIAKGLSSFAYQGVALFDVVGARNLRPVADSLNQLSYSVAVLADSDNPNQFSNADAHAIAAAGVSVTLWEGGSVSPSSVLCMVAAGTSLTIMTSICPDFMPSARTTCPCVTRYCPPIRLPISSLTACSGPSPFARMLFLPPAAFVFLRLRNNSSATAA